MVADPAGASAPVVDTDNTDTMPLPAFDAASKPPLGLNATEDGWAPPASVADPAGVSTPPAPTEKSTTASKLGWAVASRAPFGLNATPRTAVRLWNGEPTTGVIPEAAPPAHRRPRTGDRRASGRRPRRHVATSESSSLLGRPCAAGCRSTAYSYGRRQRVSAKRRHVDSISDRLHSYRHFVARTQALGRTSDEWTALGCRLPRTLRSQR